MKDIGVYIHIPFCKQKCFYCDFLSFSSIEKMQEKYFDALLKEMENFFSKNSLLSLKTIYIGGGTPSYIDAKYIKDIILFLDKKNLLDKKNVLETTIEINPGTASEEKLDTYKKLGINRLSIGLQTTNDILLKQIGRIHNYQDFIKTYKIARSVGFENINIDLMIGLPNQTIQDIKDALKKVIKLEPEHISIYSLIIEGGTKLYQDINDGISSLPHEEIERNMY